MGLKKGIEWRDLHDKDRRVRLQIRLQLLDKCQVGIMGVNRENLRPPPTMAKFKSCFLRESELVGNAAVSKPVIWRISTYYFSSLNFFLFLFLLFG